MALSKEFSREVDNAIKVAEKHTKELLRLPGVVIVGAGSRRKQGKVTGEAAIIISVREKLSKKELKERGWARLPLEIDGVPVDIVKYQSNPLSKVAQKEMDKIIKVKESVEFDWLDRENITGVGAGPKITNGRMTEQLCIQIYVEKKMTPAQMKKKKIKAVPKRIKGIPTDVIVMPRLTMQASATGSRGDRKDPLVGGCSIGTASKVFSFGTFGAVVFDAADNQHVLSNEHVLDSAVGENVVQPGQVGLEGFEIEFQLDVCNPLNFIRLDTPNTVGGSILAGAAAAAAIAAALSDKIDPTREGQKNTTPPANSFTYEEYTHAEFEFPQFPIPGTRYPMHVKWEYERRTTNGNKNYTDAPQRENEHYLLFSKLITDRTLYHPDDIIKLIGIVIDDPTKSKKRKRKCDKYFCVAHIYPLGKDEDHPVILKPYSKNLGKNLGFILDNDDNIGANVAIANEAYHSVNGNVNRGFSGIFDQLTDDEIKIVRKYGNYLCLFVGAIPARDLPLGPWKKWMYVQTVNDVPPGTDLLKAAQTIGGLPVSQNFTSTLDIACGPFNFDDDGGFDIELISA